MIAWNGPNDGCYGWIRRRVEQATTIATFHAHDLDAILSTPQCTRIIVAVRNRLDYPWQLVRRLEQQSQVLPWALLVDNWWDGARRTGIGNPGHIIWPWYRWWEGWFPWLYPERCIASHNTAQLFSPVHAPIDTQRAIGFNQSTTQQQVSSKRFSMTSEKPLLIFAGCSTTAESWRECAKLVGLQTRVFRSPEAWLEMSMKSDAAHTGCLLIDDSAYLDAPVQQQVNRMNEDIQAIVAQYPNCPLVIAANMPRWSDWNLWSSSGACEIIAKPAYGVPLCQFLNSTFQTDAAVEVE